MLQGNVPPGSKISQQMLAKAKATPSLYFQGNEKNSSRKGSQPPPEAGRSDSLQTLDGNGWTGIAENMCSSVTAKGQVEMIKARSGGGGGGACGSPEHSWVMKRDCWDDIKDTETSPASLGRLFCGMRDLGKSNCFFFASSYVKHTQSSHREGCQQLGMVKLKGIKCG